MEVLWSFWLMVLYGELISLGTMLAFWCMPNAWLLFLYVPLDPKSVNLHCVNRTNTLNPFDLYFFQVNFRKSLLASMRTSPKQHPSSMTEKCRWISNSKEGEQREPLVYFLSIPPLGLKIWVTWIDLPKCVSRKPVHWGKRILISDGRRASPHEHAAPRTSPPTKAHVIHLSESSQKRRQAVNRLMPILKAELNLKGHEKA